MSLKYGIEVICGNFFLDCQEEVIYHVADTERDQKLAFNQVNNQVKMIMGGVVQEKVKSDTVQNTVLGDWAQDFINTPEFIYLLGILITRTHKISLNCDSISARAVSGIKAGQAVVFDDDPRFHKQPNGKLI